MCEQTWRTYANSMQVPVTAYFCDGWAMVICLPIVSHLVINISYLLTIAKLDNLNITIFTLVQRT